MLLENDAQLEAQEIQLRKKMIFEIGYWMLLIVVAKNQRRALVFFTLSK